jgi:hypothetical protein
VIFSAGRHELNTNIAGLGYVLSAVDNYAKPSLFCKPYMPFIRYFKEVIVMNGDGDMEGGDGDLTVLCFALL